VKFLGTIEIQRDIEDVFEFIASPEKLLGGVGFVRVAEGQRQLGVGTVYAVEAKVGPVKAVMEYKVTDYYRPIRISYEITAPKPGESGRWSILTRRKRELPPIQQVYQLERSAKGTLITLTDEYPMSFAYILFPLLKGPLGRQMMRRQLRKLKAKIETDPPG